MNRLRRRSEFLRRLHAEMLELRLPLDGDTEILTSLQVMSMTPTDSGVKVRFNQPLNTAVLNSADNIAWGASDITLSGAASGPIAGSVVADRDHQGFTFIKTGNPWLDDNYTVTLRSAADGIAGQTGDVLDGNSDGTAGDNFVRNFSVALPESAVTVSVGDFMRGYGQAVNLPANSNAGIPITLSTGLNVSAATIVVEYDPNLLTITGGSTSLAGGTVSLDTSTPGRVVVQVTSDSQFSETDGPITLANLTATVPVAAPYAAKEILDLTVVSLTDATPLRAAIPALADDGFHVASFRGDLNGDQLITSGDITLVSRFQSGTPETVEFRHLQLVDPQFAADMNDDGLVTAADPAGMLQFLSGEAGGFPQIPQLPIGLTPPMTFGADPQIFIPTTGLSGGVGAVITVPIKINVTEVGGISFAGTSISFTYDSSRFSISNVRFGAALFGLGFSTSNNLLPAGSAVLVSAVDVGPTFAQGFVGDLYLFDLTVLAGAATGNSAINLLATTNASDNDTANLLIAPAISNGADVNDGVITVIGANSPPTISDITDQSTNEDTPTAAIPFTIGDVETAAASLTVSATSSNTTLVPNANLVFGGSGASRTITATPASNQSGTTTITVTVDDGTTTTSDTFVLTVNAVNDMPVFASGGNVTVGEDSGAYSSGQATGISDSDPEVVQALTFNVSNDNNALFSVQPALNSSGSLTFTPASNANGTATVTVSLTDDNTAGGAALTTATQTFTITLSPVNDGPVFTVGASLVVNEDSGAFAAAHATGIDDGDAGVTQSLTFNVTNGNNALFSVQPFINASGVLMFTPAGNANGGTTVIVTLTDDGTAGGAAGGAALTTATQMFTIDILPVNDMPVFAVGGNVTVGEDSGAYSAGQATGISDSDPEVTQSLTFSATNNNNGLFSVQPTLSPTGVLTFTPAGNANGSALVTVSLTDDNTAGGAALTTATQTFTINVSAVNDMPSFAVGGNVTAGEDSGAYSAAQATAINDGDPEVTQSLTFNVTNGNNALFSVQPAIDSAGMLTFTPALNANGITTVTVTLTDDGTAGGAALTSASQSFTITLSPVNDMPSFAVGGNVNVNEDSVAYSAPQASSINDGDAEWVQGLTFNASNNNNGLFSVQPTLSPAGLLTFTPALNANGTATVTVTLTDDGAAGGPALTTTSQSFTITLSPVNDPPVFAVGGPVTVSEDSGAYSAGQATGIDDGDAGVTQALTFTVTNNANALFSVQPALNSAGQLTFTPAANANGSALVTVTLTDDGAAGGAALTTASQTFTINVTAVNDTPSFVVGGNATVGEDSGAYSAAQATGIDDGDPVITQALTFNVSNNNNGLFSSQPALNSAGLLTFTPAANANGSATVTVSLTDDGTAGGAALTTATQTFTINVTAVNDMPVFAVGGNVTVNEDSGAYSAAQATGIDDGDPVITQALTFNVSNDAAAKFSVQPAINSAGLLTFTPAPNANGLVNVTVSLTDDGTAGGAALTTATQTFTINITAVNDMPSFTVGGNVTVNEDSGAYSAGQAGSINDGDPEVAQGLTFNVSNGNNALFSSQPAISPTGVLTFTPALNANGSTTVTVSLTDDGTAGGGALTTTTQTFTINLTPVNDMPVFAVGGNVTVAINSGAYSSGQATGIDDGDLGVTQTLMFNVSSTNPGLFSTLPAISSAGLLTFTPDVGMSGSSTVTVSLTDDATAGGAALTTTPQTFTITVSGDVAPPTVTAPANQTINEDNSTAALTVTVGDNVTAPGALNVTFSSSNTTLIPNANLVLGGAGTNRTITVTPASNQNGGPVTITITVTDAASNSSSASFQVNVTPVNDMPVFTGGGNITVNEDSGAYSAGQATGISDSDPEVAQSLTFNVTNNNNGLFSVQPTLSPTGVLTFTPAGNANGSATVTVSLTDDNTAGGAALTTASQTFTINVTPVNDPPTALADLLTISEDDPAAAVNVLSNDSFAPDTGETLLITSFTPPANGTVVITGGGTGLTFQPNANFNGATSFTYTISDGNGGTATATVSVMASPVNDPPTATNDTLTVAENAPATPVNVLANDSFAPDTGETLTITSFTPSPNGTVVITGGGTGLTFQPTAFFNGATSFTYTISDGNGGNATATVNVNVTSVNQLPTALNDTATVAEDAPSTAINVLANDSILPDTGETLTITSFTPSPNGTVVITGGGTGLTFQPAANFNGSTSFTYTISDGNGGNATATVNVTVTAANDNPTATGDTATVAEDAPATAISVLTNDSFAPDTGESLSITAVTQPANGTVAITGGGTGLTFQPALNFFGSTSFTYTISDGNGGNATATVNVTVTPVNDLPTFVVGPNPLINEDAGPQNLLNWATGISVGPANEIGQTLLFVVSNDNSSLFSAQPALNSAGDLSYTPALNAFGTATVTVVLSDSAGGTAVAQTFTIDVTPVNDLPTISNIVNQSIFPNTSTAALPFTVGDIETPAGLLNITFASSNTTLAPLAGITIAGSGANRTITVTPAVGQTGNSTITLTVDDGNGGLATDSFVLTVSNLVGTLTVQLVGGNLMIEDLVGRNNEFEIHVSGGNLLVTDAAEMFDPAAAAAAGGTLSNGNRTLSVPLASITGAASVFGRDGEDSYVLGDLTGLNRLELLGGNGNDLFGTPAQKISPAPSTTIIISGAEDSAFGAPATRNTFGATGDVLNLDLSAYSTGIEIVDTVSGLALSASTPLVAHQPLYFNNVEDINLCDNSQATNASIGDLYVRTTAGNDSLVFYRGYSSVTDVLTKLNGRLISSTPFRPTGTILFYGRGGNDTAEMNFTLGTQVRAEFHGEGGNDTLWGAGHNDLLVGGGGSDMLIASDGNDTLWGDEVPTTWLGRQSGGTTPGGDSLYGGGGSDFLFGQGGNDKVYGEGGDDYSHGGDGNDTLVDTSGVNILRGEGGADSISGGIDGDIILGGADNDVITGFGGRDIMIGGNGLDNVNDTGDNADDVLIGDSSPLESDDNGTNFAELSNHDVALNSVFGNWQSAAPFAARVTAIQSSGLKATASDGSRDVMRGNQLNNNYFQNLGQAELVRTTGTGDVIDDL